jgi:hypothetical protein
MRSLLWVCAALVVIEGIMSTNLWRELRAERELVDSLRIQVAEAVSPGRPLVASGAAPQATTPASSATASPIKMPSDAALAAANYADAVAAGRKAAERERELWKDPDYRNARLAQIRLTIPGSYPGLAEELGLTAAEEAALFDRIAEYQLDMNGTITQAVPVGNDAAVDAGTSNRLQEISRQRDTAIAAQLGPARYAQWQQYVQNSAARSEATSMNSALTQAGHGLNAAQLRSLTTVLIKESQRQREEATVRARSANVQDQVSQAQFEEVLRTTQDESRQRIVTAATSFLNADQLAVVRAQMEQQTALSRALSRARNRFTPQVEQGGFR